MQRHDAQKQELQQITDEMEKRFEDEKETDRFLFSFIRIHFSVY